MARAVVGNPFENQIPTVSPTAQPVDIYQRGVVKSSPFASLAENLSRLSQKADRAFGNVEKRAAEREFAEGQELYNKTRLAIGDAVREGIIDEGESPYLRKGYRVSQLNVLANKYATDLNVALEAQQLYKNGNPAAAAKFSQDFYNKFVEANDLSGFAPTELAEFLTPTTQKANAAFISSWKTKNISWQREQNYIQLQEEIGVYTNSLYDGTPTSEDKKTALSTWIQSKLDGAEANGMDRQKVNKAIVDAVIITALENNDLERLKVLDTIKAGTGFLGDRVDVRKAMLAAENTIQSAKAAKAALELRQEAADIKEKRGVYVTGALAAAIDVRNALTEEDRQNAQGVLDKAILQLGALGLNGDQESANAARVAINFFDTMKKYADDETKVDEAASAQAFSEIIRSKSYEEALLAGIRAMENGDLTVNEASGLVDRVNRRLKAGFIAEDMDTPRHPAKISLDLLINTATSKITESFLKFNVTMSEEATASIIAPLKEKIYDEYSQAYMDWKYDFKDKEGRLPNAGEARIQSKIIKTELAQSFVDPTIETTLQETLKQIATDRAGIAKKLAADEANRVAAEKIKASRQLEEEAARAAEQAGKEFDEAQEEIAPTF